MNEFIYAVEDAETGKFVSDITNPKRKYWDRKGNAAVAIRNHMNGHHRKYKKLRLVTLQLEHICSEDIDY